MEWRKTLRSQFCRRHLFYTDDGAMKKTTANVKGEAANDGAQKVSSEAWLTSLYILIAQSGLLHKEVEAKTGKANGV